MRDARRALVAVREGRERRRRRYDSVRLSQTTARVPASLILLRVLKQLSQPLTVTKGLGAAGQPQNTLPTIIHSQSTPTELTPLPISFPARLSLPGDRVIPYNGFATVEGARKRSFTCLGVRMSKRTGRRTRPCTQSSQSRCIRRCVCLQRGRPHGRRWLPRITHVGSAPHSTPMA